MTKRALAIVLVTALACARGTDSRTPGDSAWTTALKTKPDSAGWRFAYVAGPDLWLRYPIGRVAGVRNEWTRDCTQRAPLFAREDTTWEDQLIVRSAPAPFDSSVALAAFVPREEGKYGLEPTDGFSEDVADTITVGPWRALSSAVEYRVYIDGGDSVSYVPPKDNPNATMPPAQLFARRVVVVGPGAGGCTTLLAFQGHTTIHADSANVIDTSLIRAILGGVHR